MQLVLFWGKYSFFVVNLEVDDILANNVWTPVLVKYYSYISIEDIFIYGSQTLGETPA